MVSNWLTSSLRTCPRRLQTRAPPAAGATSMCSSRPSRVLDYVRVPPQQSLLSSPTGDSATNLCQLSELLTAARFDLSVAIQGVCWTTEMAAVCASQPVVVKLATGTGTEGVRLCATLDAARAHVEWLLAHRKSAPTSCVSPPADLAPATDGDFTCASAEVATPDGVVVQEYVAGDEFAIDTVSSCGVHKVRAVAHGSRRLHGWVT